MIKFEEHDGKLFLMLDKPTPLTPDAEMPCLVRLIQDDSPMGKHNKDLHGFDPERLTPRICTEVIDVNDLSDPNRGSARCDGLMSIQYYRYELIGTLVKEGSADWAWYQMMKGEKICHKKSPSVMYCKHASGIRREAGYNYVAFDMSISVWLNGADKNGWQIYTEPKPLLADAGIGDIVKTNLGDWLQIVDTPCLRFGHDECYRTHDGLYWYDCGVCDVDSTYRIVAVEPLAPEGSKDWAWQMMLLGKIIIHSGFGVYRHENATWKMNNGTARSCLAGKSACSKEQWVANAFGNGWEIYKEPELKYKVGDWVECKDPVGVPTQCKFLEIREHNVIVECKTGHIWSLPHNNIIRKLKPSEIVVRIGCLSGTIAKSSDPNYFLMLHSRPITDCNHSIIRFSAIDTPTREIVESLLKAQEEEK